jgi:excisionase family DNA binding protein
MINKRTGTESTNYTNVHKWLKEQYGKACRCENPDCQAKVVKRHDWSLIHGCEYERKRENFRQLCSKCHMNYDKPLRKRKPKGAAKNNGVKTLFTISDVMEQLSISRTQVWKLTKDGQLVGYKIGRSVRYKQDDVEKLLQPIN